MQIHVYLCGREVTGEILCIKTVDEVVVEQRAHDFLALSLSHAYRVACCNPSFHPLWIAEHNTKGHTRHFRDMVKLCCVVQGRSID